MHSRGIKIVLLLALVVRLSLLAAAWNNEGGVFTPDSKGYVQLARTLVDGRFVDDAGRPEIFRTPGYPLFMLVGVPAGPELGWRVVLIVQVLIDVALVYLTYLLGSLLCGGRAGVLAAGLQAISAVAVASSLRILSDGLFAFLLTLAVLLLVFHWRSGRRWAIIACAGSLVAATYVRPVGLVYVMLIGAFLAIAATSRLLRRRRASRTSNAESRMPNPVSSLGLFAAICLAGLCPWVLRNAATADYVGFSSFAADSVYFYAAPEVLVRREGISPEAARLRMHKLDEQDEAHHSKPRMPGQAVEFRERISREIIGQDRGLYLRLHLRGVVGYFMPAANEVLEIAGLSSGQRGTSDILRQQGVWAAAKYYFGGNWQAMALAVPMVLILLVQYAGVLAWVVTRTIDRIRGRSREAGHGVGEACLSASFEGDAPAMAANAAVVPPDVRSMTPVIVLLAVMVGVSSLLSGPFGLPRYRVPMMPIINLAAAAGLMVLGGLLRTRRR